MGILQGFSQRRRNAVVLLSVLASILEEHHTLTDKIFWSSGGQRLIKLILGFFRNVIEADMKNKNYEVLFFVLNQLFFFSGLTVCGISHNIRLIYLSFLRADTVINRRG